MKSKVFEQTSLSGILLKNRIIRSATHEGMADENGYPTDQLKKLYVRLAKGGAGAIITGYAGVSVVGKSNLFRMTMIDTDDHIPAFREITAAVHAHDTPVIMQIAHCGRQTRSKRTGHPTVAPSALRDAFFNEELPRQLSDDEIKATVDDFAAAIGRAKQADFDGVQLHLAHGYLLSQFLSPYTNRREDRWGGSTGNRYRIIDEIFRKAKAQVGDFPILAKINAYDGRKGGMRIDEAVRIAQMLENSGCAAIEVSCGVFEDGLLTVRSKELPVEAIMAHTFKYKRLPGWVKRLSKPVLKKVAKQPKPLVKYNLRAAQKIKAAMKIPVIVVGGYNHLEDIEHAVENADIDFVSMCRPFIIEPDIVKKFENGTQSGSKCIMCNYCLIIAEEKPLRCYYGRLPDRARAGDRPIS